MVFRFVTFESDAYFIGTKFYCDTAFERINFKENVNFANADFKLKDENRKHRFCFSYLNFTKLLISWKQLPDYDLWIRNGDDKIKSFMDIENEKKKIDKGFLKEEFRQLYTIDGLCDTIKDNNNDIRQYIKEEIHDNTIEWLNAILSIPDLYDSTMVNNNSKNLSERLNDLIVTTIPIRKKVYEKLNDDEKLEIKRLNRLMLEEAYPQKAPKFLEDEKREPLNQVLGNLETTFRNQNKVSDANSAYYYKKHEELKDIRGKENLSWTRTGMEAAWFGWLPSGYGVRLKRICVVSGGIYLFFVIFYFFGGRLTRGNSEESQHFSIKTEPI